MDINFHYFAVRTIAEQAGFDADDAQLIAAYSQFVDDFTEWQNYWFKTVPDYAKGLAKNIGLYYSFDIITTGFGSALEMARLAIPTYQKNIVVPFHFVPRDILSETLNHTSRREYCTYPADITGTSLIAELLVDAKEGYMAAEGRYTLMRVGMLLHIFADTYAHQNFSGFHGWENYCHIVSLTATDTEEPVEDESSLISYDSAYSIGHANAGHAPDLTYAKFELTYAENETQRGKDSYTGTHSRNNTTTFLDASKQIYTLLYQIRHNNNKPTEAEWEFLRQFLYDGFMLRGTDIDTLCDGWNKICPDISYHYSVKELWQDQLVGLSEKERAEMEVSLRENGYVEKEKVNWKIYKTAKDDFFYYNVIAKEIRDAITR